MSGKPDVTAGQLTQAAGCVVDNPCHPECVQVWQETLDEWDELPERERRQALELAEWVKAQTWLP